MPKITLDLNKFKANGVYTVEFDATDSFTISSQQLRLVVGFSRKGPFNAPVFLQDIKSAKKIFGEIDTFLEKKGSFFHRAIETALQTGPIFALNLMPLNNTPSGDKIDYRSFSLSMNDENSEVSQDLMASFFNKERFWFPDSTYFDAIINNNPLDEGKLISFTNLGQKPVSVLVRKAIDIKGFDITARDYFGIGNIPEFIRDFDFISDYFIDVIVVEGDWTDYNNLSIDPDYSTYFDNTGIKVDKINSFLSADTVTLIANFTGCIIPDFTDKQGVNQYIETIVNNAQGVTGLFMTINRDALDDYENSTYKVDLIGHSLINTSRDRINMLSYVSPITDELGYSSNQTLAAENIDLEYNNIDFSSAGDIYPYIKSIPYVSGDTRGMFLNTLVIPKPRALFTGQVFTLDTYNDLLKNITPISLLKTYEAAEDAWKYVKVESITNTGTSIEIVYSNPGDGTHADKSELGVTADMTITAVNTTTNTFTTLHADAADLEKFDLVYVKGANKYMVVKSVTSVSPGYEIEFFETRADVIADGGYAAVNWLNYEKSLATSMLVTTDMVTKVAVGCEVVTAKSLVTEFVAGTPNTLTYIDKPIYMYLDGTDTNIVVLPGNNLYTDVTNNTVINGDIVSKTADYNSFNYLSFEAVTGLYGLTCLKIKQWQSEELTSPASTKIALDSNYTYTKDGVVTNSTYWDGGHGFVMYSAHNVIEENVEIIEDTLNAAKTSFYITADNSSKIQVGQYLVTNNVVNPSLTKVISKIKRLNPSTNEVEYLITINEPVRVQEIGSPVKYYVTRFLSINDPNFTTNLQFTKLGGFTITTYHVPGTPEQLDKILGVLENTNLSNVLADKEMIQFRYLVDTFGFGLAPMMGPKAILSRLAKKRQKCMAILNAPSITDFIASTDPRFTEEPDPANGNPKPVLNTAYIATGGNLSLGPSFRFSLPDDENGARFCGVFSPYLKIRENNKNKMVPPAADVSNNFIRKFKNGTPYAIAAGPRRGVLSNPKLVGLEYEFLDTDRENLEPFGFNCIITTRKTGPMIYGNATAYQKTLSAFNNLHVRDLLIIVEETIEDILSNYIFEYNDPQTRLEIKTIVDGYLQNVKNAGGIYDFLVVMDESNNTKTIIDQNIGIIDVGIEPVRGLQKIINRVTVLKTGSISSGGFTVA